jgi:cytoskeletal protein RodZ
MDCRLQLTGLRGYRMYKRMMSGLGTGFDDEPAKKVAPRSPRQLWRWAWILLFAAVVIAAGLFWWQSSVAMPMAAGGEEMSFSTSSASHGSS